MQNFLNTHSEILSAYSWGQYRQHGAGIIYISIGKYARASWTQFYECPPAGKELCKKCDYERQCVVWIRQHSVLFTPPTPPPVAFSKIGGQWQDFIINQSEAFQW